MDVFASQAGARPASLTARRRESSRWWSVSRHLFLLSKAEVTKRCLPGRMSREVDPSGSCRRTGWPAVTCSAASIRLCRWQTPLASRAGRTRPLVDLGWARPVRVDLRDGQLQRWNQLPASGNPSWPGRRWRGRYFGRGVVARGPKRSAAVRSGWSAVLGVDAVGGPPHGDFTDEGGARVAARRRPYRLVRCPGWRSLEPDRRGR